MTNRKKRIAIDSSFLDGRKAMGTAIVIRNHLEKLKNYEDEFEITLIHKETKFLDEIYANYNEIVIPKLWKWKYGGFINELLFFAKYWIDIILHRKTVFDCYFVFYSRLLPSFIFAPSKNFIFHAMDGGPATSGFSQQKSRFYWYVKLFSKRIKGYVALTRFGQKGIMSVFKVPENMVPIVPNGIEPQYRVSGLTKEELRKIVVYKYKLPSDFILCVSRWDPHKNILNLLQAYARYRYKQEELGHTPLPLLFVGGRHMPQYSQSVDELITVLKLEQFIVVAPYIEIEDMPLVYELALFMVFPSYYEGFGLPVLEAMACGCPTALASIEALTEIGADAARYFSPNDITGMSESLVCLHNDIELRKDLINRGFMNVKKYTWDHATEQLANVLKSFSEL